VKETNPIKDSHSNLRLWLLCVILSVAVEDRAAAYEELSKQYFDSIDVSLLTCEPHDEVYSLYGHTAIRVQDRNNNSDFAVNFGVFDSSADNFALRFIFGLTDYMMGCVSFDSFLAEYSYYGSAVYEQHLNLTAEEKRNFMNALAENSLPENVVYRYNYFYNNCTTKARDLILNSIDGNTKSRITALQKGERSFRDMIHMKVEGHPWARVGNDLLLGVGSDFNTTYEEREFLPEVLMSDFDNTVIHTTDGKTRKLVDGNRQILKHQPSTVHTGSFPLTPTQCAWILFAAILTLSLAETLIIRRRLLWLEYSVICLYGAAGMVLFAMLFSEHPTVRVNLQILVFNPLLPILAFPKLKWQHGYTVIAIMLVLFFVGNTIQQYAEGMNIMALSLSLITLKHFLPKYFGNSEKNN